MHTNPISNNNDKLWEDILSCQDAESYLFIGEELFSEDREEAYVKLQVREKFLKVLELSSVLPGGAVLGTLYAQLQAVSVMYPWFHFVICTQLLLFIVIKATHVQLSHLTTEYERALSRLNRPDMVQVITSIRLMLLTRQKLAEVFVWENELLEQIPHSNILLKGDVANVHIRTSQIALDLLTTTECILRRILTSTPCSEVSIVLCEVQLVMESIVLLQAKAHLMQSEEVLKKAILLEESLQVLMKVTGHYNLEPAIFVEEC